MGEESKLLPDEEVVSTRKRSILTDTKFWIGIGVLILSAVIFILIDLFFPSILSLSGLLSYAGVSLGGSALGGIPIIPLILVIVGFVYILVAELDIYFTEYAVTNMRVVMRTGIINRDSNTLLPSKIEDVNVYTGLIEELFGLGRVVIIMQQDSRPPVVISGIRDPYKFQGDILKLIGTDSAHTKVNENGVNKAS